MLALCNTFYDTMYFGGRGAVVMWQWGDWQAKYVCTYNLHMVPDFVPRLVDEYVATTRRALNNNQSIRKCPMLETLILGQGNSTTKNSEAQGWRNKKLASRAIMPKIKDANCRCPIFVYMTSSIGILCDNTFKGCLTVPRSMKSVWDCTAHEEKGNAHGAP